MKILVFLISLLAAIPAFAQTLETLNQQITALDLQIAESSKEYAKLNQINAQRLQKVEAAKAKNDNVAAELELRAAYASADQLSEINTRLNTMRQEKSQLCNQWREIYRKSIDDLLNQAEQEKERKKKAVIGRKLQQYQQWNAAICVGNHIDSISEQWRSVKIENYDGPQEIKQKIQLLTDITRELRITIAKLDTSYQDAIREQKTKERAEEFIQEGTLFNDGSTMLTSARSTPNEVNAASGPPVSSFSAQPPAPSGNSATSQPLFLKDWESKENVPLTEKDYQKSRADLVALQKELQTKIDEFEKKEKEFQVP
ncbi:MAG: hypothetical protein C5B54_11810 [Acidobacteria bacterium]|nr:MAG: hypothetical protein C5B54_11810 [Acidobacteriota bacterium]